MGKYPSSTGVGTLAVAIVPLSLFLSLFLWLFRQRSFLTVFVKNYTNEVMFWERDNTYYCNSNKNRTVKVAKWHSCVNFFLFFFFSSRKEAPDIPYNLTVTDSRNKTTTVNYVPDTLSNPYGWMVLLLDKETYMLTFDNPLVSKQLQVTQTFFITSKLYLEEIVMLSSFWVGRERKKKH